MASMFVPGAIAGAAGALLKSMHGSAETANLQLETAREYFGAEPGEYVYATGSCVARSPFVFSGTTRLGLDNGGYEAFGPRLEAVAYRVQTHHVYEVLRSGHRSEEQQLVADHGRHYVPRIQLRLVPQPELSHPLPSNSPYAALMSDLIGEDKPAESICELSPLFNDKLPLMKLHQDMTKEAGPVQVVVNNHSSGDGSYGSDGASVEGCGNGSLTPQRTYIGTRKTLTGLQPETQLTIVGRKTAQVKSPASLAHDK